jgi:hypothetical protein
VAPLARTNLNLSATATVSPDQRYLRLSVNPLFTSGFRSGL